MTQPASLAHQRIAILGCGSLGESLLAGLRERGHPAALLSASSRRPERRQALAERYGIATAADNAALAAVADIIVLAVKPKQMAEFCRDLAAIPLTGKLLVSVAAGIRTDQLQRWLSAASDAPLAIVRSMPNTPAALGLAATGLYADRGVNASQRALTDQLFAAIGRSVWLEDESLMDLVTAIAGSGPAYYFAIMEAMLASAIAQGMPAATADLLIRQTALGASSLATATTAPALAELRQRVTSPGGTTEAALKTLAAHDLAGIMDTALRAAVARGKELAAAND
ncbi:pyrroline-5-carboxylate reductase [Permianibacter sp. IMCC34836]|uniref:pyrroline-5-carboxylate reductase n=1 Tax=Permianibacter fluminis TaxID=2738515 RepID=UPI001553E2C8|nr:pyrroline-5-carboxylate reductase [Permianibacter fluminis]NQD35823.1 pyrroline-5-carboxylate reductase [Permianibacter fluminis]